jgi:hypothetical protein
MAANKIEGSHRLFDINLDSQTKPCREFTEGSKKQILSRKAIAISAIEC